MVGNQISPQIAKEELKYKNSSEQMRIVRGYAIISKGDTPKQTGKEVYIVPSQNGGGEYTITKNGKWKCNCPDFKKRRRACKHIYAVKFFLDFQKKLKEQNLKVQEVKEKQNCAYCGCSDVIRCGIRKNKQVIKQRFKCNGCGKKFIADKDFERMKGDAKVTTLILDLFFKGISSRGIQDHLKQFYDISLDHSNILRRIQKFSKVINEYVKTLKPELSNVWHIDEMKIQANGKWRWLWNLMDAETKFLISEKVTDKRRIRDCRKLLTEAKETAQREPAFMITDGCHSYNRSLSKVMPQTNHVQLKSITDKRVNNNNVERLNGIIRDRLKVMRGMHSKESSELMMTAYRNYYNFIRPHSAIGMTPAEKSGIVSEDGHRWLNIIQKAFNNSPKQFNKSGELPKQDGQGL
jgi:transposase-like protein